VAQEIELKLSLLTDDTNRVFDLPLLMYSANHHLYDLENTYYDTPDCHLAQQGLTLRIRKSDEGWIQTVKTQGHSEQGLHQRDEYSVILDKPMIDLGQIEHEGIVQQLTDIIKAHEIKPLFVTLFSRSAWILNVDDSNQVEMVFDQGKVRVGHQALSINEIELELQQGKSVATLYQLAGIIAESLPIGIDIHSKAWKGYQLYQATQAKQQYQLPIMEQLDQTFFYQQAVLSQ